jgi:hypothetical protein
MMASAGNKNYEVFLKADLQGNVKIVFEYKPTIDNSKK